MKVKLTVTIDSELLPRARRYARARGLSLSGIIEEALQKLSSEDSSSFVERWRGRFQPASRDERFRALARKYL